MPEYDNYSPEMVAKTVFTQQPRPPCSNQIVSKEDGDATYIFEIVLTVFMEGLDLITGGLDKADLSDFTKEHLTVLDPWMNSLGLKLLVNEYEKDSFYLDDWYCKTVIKNGSYSHLFDIKNIHKNYHFLGGPNHKEVTEKALNLKEIYTVFVNKDKVYTIQFDFFTG